MKKTKHILLFICISTYLQIGSFAFSQSSNQQIDSLFSLLKKDKEDTTKVNHLSALAWELRSNNLDTSILFANQALAIASSANQFSKWKQFATCKCFHQLGVFNRLKGDYPKALDYDFKSLAILDKLEKDSEYPQTLIRNRKSTTLGNIGIVYDDQGNYPKALDYYFKALKMDEELGNKNGIARHLGNIGLVYQEQASTASPDSLAYRERLYTKALDYYFQALKMDEELGDKRSEAINLGNIGIVYHEQAKSPKVSLAKHDSLFNRTLDYYFKALKIDEELKNKNGIARHLGNIGSLYISKKKYAEAERYLNDGLKLDKEIGAMDSQRLREETLADLYTKTNRYRLALEHYKKAMVLKDTLFNAEKNKEITRKEMNYEFEKKEAAQKAEQNKKEAVALAEAKRQHIVLLLVSCFLLLVIVFSGFIFRALRITRKQKQIIETQKKKVEEKQKEILDSIHYAKRIQTALLPTEKYITKSLKRLMKN